MDNDYYLIKPSVDNEETGSAYPAVVPVDNYNFDGPRSVYKIRSTQFPDFIPDLRYKLERGAKLTDVMTDATSNAKKLLISQRLYEFILSNAILPNHRFYEISIETKNGIITYFFMHFISPELIEYIDFEKSIFYKKKFSDNLGLLDIKSYTDFQAVKAELGTRFMIGIQEMVLLQPIPYDIFLVSSILPVITISKRFYENLIQQKFTGIEIKPYNLTF